MSDSIIHLQDNKTVHQKHYPKLHVHVQNVQYM